MRMIRICGVLLGLFAMFAARGQGSGTSDDDPSWGGGSEVIRESIDMGLDTIKACIDKEVVLRCSDAYDPKDILSYRWINKETGEVVSENRTVVVRPKKTTVYQLIIKYKMSHNERIYNGDFERGELDCYFVRRVNDFTGCGEEWKSSVFESDYRYIICNGNQVLYPEGLCKIARNANEVHRGFRYLKDHTSGSGYMFVANGSPAASRDKVVWKTKITGMIPGKQYAFSAWVASVGGVNPPMLDFSINGKTLGGQYEYYRPVSDAKWEQFYRVWTADKTTAEISVVNKINVTGGNDFTLDDVSFAPVVEGYGEIEVKVLPQVNMSALENVQVCEGKSVWVEANAVGSGDLSYSWVRARDGAELSKTVLLGISGADPARDNGKYYISVTGTCGMQKDSITVSVREKLRVNGPKVDTVSVCVNSSALLSASRTSGYNLKYSWRAPADNWKNPGPGWLPAMANSQDYRKSYVGFPDAGKYRCIVISDGGKAGTCGIDTVYSVLDVDKVALLSVSGDTLVCAGSPVKLSARAASKSSQVFWREWGGVFRKGNTMEIVADPAVSQYEYKVEGCGGPLSGFVSVNTFPEMGGITVSPDTLVCEGGRAVLRVAVRGVGLKYEWTRQNVAGVTDVWRATSPQVVISPLSVRDTGLYHVVVTDTCGHMKEADIHLSLRQEYKGIMVSPSQSVCVGESVIIEMTGGVKNVKYEWTVPSGARLQGARLSLSNVQAADAGKYVCRVTGVCPGVEKEATLIVNKHLHAVAGKQDFRECARANVSLSVSATGTNVSALWKRNGVEVYRGMGLTLYNLSVQQTGVYACEVTSMCGDTTLYFNVAIKDATRITAHSPDTYVGVDDMLSVYVNAQGENNRFEWKLDGVAVGTNSNRLTLEAFGKDRVGDYLVSCRVTGDCGTDEITFKIYVREFSYITENTSLRLCEGQAYTYRVMPKLPSCVGGDTTYRLEFNGSVISSGSVLAFTRFDAANCGVYTWKVRSACGEATIKMDVSMSRQPEIKELFCDKAVLQDADTIVICEGEEVKIVARPLVREPEFFEWSRDGNVIFGSSDSVLILKNAQTGKYTCRIANTCGSSQKSFFIRLRRNLAVEGTSLKKMKICRGDQAELSVEVNVPDAVFAWSGPDQPNWKAEQRKYVGYYRNASVSRDLDNGQYVCRVESACGSAEVTFALEVEKQLSLLSVPKSDTVCLDGQVRLAVNCNIPEAVCVWTMPGGQQVNGWALDILSMSASYTGTYHYKVNSLCAETAGTVDLSMYRQMGELIISRDTAVCENSAVHVKGNVEGDGVVYGWLGPRGFTETRPEFDIPALTAQNAGRYDLHVTDICGVEKQATVKLSLLEDLSGLKITGDTIVCRGIPVDLAVTHEGPARYEWQFRGVKVSSLASFRLAGVSAADTGTYICTVIGLCRQEEVKVHVGLYPELSVVPGAQTVRVCPGESARFEVAAAGEKVEYVWNKDGREVGYRDSILQLADVLPSEAGIYTCRISSQCGERTLDYELQVPQKTLILGHTPDRYVSVNDSARLLVRVAGDNNRFTWWDGQQVVGDGNSLLVLSGNEADTMNYRVKVTGECGSDSAHISVIVGVFRPLVESQRPDTLCAGGTYTYIADMIPDFCYGDESFTYQWSRNGITIPVTGSLLRLADVDVTADAGTYRCVMSGDCGTKIIEWKIWVMKAPEIVSVTPESYIIEGMDHQIEAVVNGDNMAYSWEKDGLSYPGTQNFLDFIPVLSSDQGTYRITATNRCGHVSTSSVLKVWQKTIIVTPNEQDIRACTGSDTVFTVKAVGASGIMYRWYHNGTQLSVPQNGILRLKNLGAADAGEYKCVASSRGGQDSCIIRLDVLALPGAEIVGEPGMCVNELTQLYSGISLEGRVNYYWTVSGGHPDVVNRPEVQVMWEPVENAELKLKVTSLQTGCVSETSQKMEFYPLPDVSFVMPDKYGYCKDSVRLNQGYPFGGFYVVDGFLDDYLRLMDKEETYVVEYHYAERCSTMVSQTVGVALEPYIRLADKNIVGGWCHPVKLAVADHSEGDIRWSGEEPLDVTDVLHPVYTPDKTENILFRAELTDQYTCKASDEALISLIPAPQVYLGRDSVVGECAPLVLRCNYYTERYGRTDWFPAERMGMTDSHTAEIIRKDPGDNQYEVAVTDEFGCAGRDSIMIRVISGPSLKSREICYGDTLVVDCSGYSEFSWSDGYADRLRVMREVGKYTLTVKDEQGCSANADYAIHSLPRLHLPDTMIFEGQSVNFRVERVGEYEPYDVRWQNGSSDDVLTAEEEGNYSVVVTDNIGCRSGDTAYLEVRKRYIAAPDAFLPSGQGENARFYLKEVNFVSNFQMYIYNRWGELVYNTSEIGFNGGWDGSFKGLKCQPGAYVWVAYSEGKEIGRGSVVLIK